ncbi:hypothetical protein AVDCRST_MAG81-4370 [uncultured Synechococcales cyanobacterium]|uniref:Uncharacterized protein n=1 Tax=uncultured Synechococcales cyanobacterium TaxID=1936017 RepID=A0A6J4VUE1_9CYAN|nr:hypothetical protein AVDCRST_MAG81-4370 [uncultured Synechococcales cyanobacterium]
MAFNSSTALAGRQPLFLNWTNVTFLFGAPASFVSDLVLFLACAGSGAVPA